jgi:hypothetical protein
VAADDAEGWPSALELWTKAGGNNQHCSYYILMCQVIQTLLPCVLHSWKGRKFLSPQPNEPRDHPTTSQTSKCKTLNPKVQETKNMILAINHLVWKLRIRAVNATAPYILTFSG